MIIRREKRVKERVSVWVPGSPPSWYSPGTRQVQVRTILQAADELRQAGAPEAQPVRFESPGGTNGIYVAWETEQEDS
jgi:uncharacterized protein (DUF58 family)